jgi:hypothetical protein
MAVTMGEGGRGVKRFPLRANGLPGTPPPLSNNLGMTIVPRRAAT